MRLFEMVLTLPQEFCTVNGRQYVPLKKNSGVIVGGGLRSMNKKSKLRKFYGTPAKQPREDFMSVYHTCCLILPLNLGFMTLQTPNSTHLLPWLHRQPWLALLKNHSSIV